MNDEYLTKNFKKSELVCPCGCNEFMLDIHILNKLQQLRDKIKIPIIISSGYRCQRRNEKVGGSVNSGHLVGKAIDFYSPNISTTILWEHLERIGINGMGHYKESNGFRFIHIDNLLRFQR